MSHHTHRKTASTGGFLAFVRTTLTLGGGLGRTVALAINVLRNEGWSGIRWRLGNARRLTTSRDDQSFRPENQSTSTRPGFIASLCEWIFPDPQARPFHSNNYSLWVKRFDTLSKADRQVIRASAQGLAEKPLISVVMAVFDPKPTWLEQAIRSVQTQLYDNWELCIADDASHDPRIRKLLNQITSTDPRIKVVFRESNGHIAEALNSALMLAEGKWIAFLDHDDLLAESALFWVVKTINDHPGARFLYSDEDKINDADTRLDPHFKPGWNYDLLLSYNYVSHLNVIRHDLVKTLGGFRTGYEGAQDHDLALRCAEALQADEIIHIPRILYHWRIHSDSTASSHENKPYAIINGTRAVQQHLERIGADGSTAHDPIGFYKVRYTLPTPAPLVSLIIPTRNGHELIRMCLQSLLRLTDYPAYEILVIDNGSDDPATLAYLDKIQSDSRVRVIRDERPFNFSALNNAAVSAARGEFVALVNNDIEVTEPGWLAELVSTASQPGVGVVGARLRYPDGRIQHAGVIVGLGGVGGHSHKYFSRNRPTYYSRGIVKQSLSALTAACFVVRKRIYLEVGGLDEVNLPIAFNDVDFCLRVRAAGYRNVYAPLAELIHHESATRGEEDTPEKKARFQREVLYMQERWGDSLLADPAYSPNLTLAYEDFSLAWPPRVPRLP
ncbi:MAG TPA: glycosyltransferase family 2 protein [Azoarcus taiwanensis]|nr:glycosyltransferase family 2 protein [Azoarcus taiwanensis]